MNRLAGETSPYLLQHADNPVDWYPWGDEAFTKARTEDKPILLCRLRGRHWCHVMEHESFEDDVTAKTDERASSASRSTARSARRRLAGHGRVAR
jgi:uncharacterized protein YyaL (SSP411 family)